MRILVVGSGGREHALVWKIAQSKLADKIFCAPGNGGVSQVAECLDIKADNISGLLDFARKEKIDLTVVGPEAPLALGIVDEFKKYDLRIFGPDKKGAQLEASKVFAKELMAKYDIPTAGFKVFDNVDEANKYVDKIGAPCVIKADGLAQGKGVIISKTVEEAKQAISLMMQERVFGKAGERVIIEECLEGEEASILVITDSKEVVALASSQDHKRIFDNDSGPNTGGMGAYSPAPIITAGLFKEILDKIIRRTIEGLIKEGIDYRGVLYAGIMITLQGPKVLEFNVRFGDPETQVILPRLKSDLLETMLSASAGKLNKIVKSGGLDWDSRACVCVVCSSKGYPGDYEREKEIYGLDEAAKMQDIVVFHAGTKKLSVVSPSTALRADGERPSTLLGTSPEFIEGRSRTIGSQLSERYVTNGGRVLGVTGLGNTIKEAIDRTYQAVEKVHFEGIHFRRDIGYKAILIRTVVPR